MFVSSGQFYVFLVCVAFGGVCGLIFSFFLPLKLATNKILGVIIDAFCFILVALLYVFVAFFLKFPSFRIYMPLGVFVGLLIYKETFNIILAKLIKRLYNITNKLILKCKSLLKAKFGKGARTKDKKDGRIKG